MDSTLWFLRNLKILHCLSKQFMKMLEWKVIQSVPSQLLNNYNWFLKILLSSIKLTSKKLEFQKLTKTLLKNFVSESESNSDSVMLMELLKKVYDYSETSGFCLIHQECENWIMKMMEWRYYGWAFQYLSAIFKNFTILSCIGLEGTKTSILSWNNLLNLCFEMWILNA